MYEKIHICLFRNFVDIFPKFQDENVDFIENVNFLIEREREKHECVVLAPLLSDTKPPLASLTAQRQVRPPPSTTTTTYYPPPHPPPPPASPTRTHPIRVRTH